MSIHVTVNGQARDVDVPPGSSLLSLLRDDLGLTGAHYGCGHGACGACYVLVDRKAVPACVTVVEHAAGKEIVTIEGLARGEVLHPGPAGFPRRGRHAVRRLHQRHGHFRCGAAGAGAAGGELDTA
ncbi:2Fe-2S iron-sulfur cluster-binding protein [Mesorhizobium sp. NZP2298]|uniref:2Fe-2S iron-sulfur cluster-binding protein n=1 Tax=Mesorhizobium sp. NZP2298 TaxID=2483403 RepID=UPI00155399E4